MKKIGVLFCLMSFLCLLCSCSKDNEEPSPIQEESVEDRLIGTWIFKSYKRAYATYTASEPSKLTFFRGGKFTYKGDSIIPWLDPTGDKIIDIEGTYSYDEETRELSMVWPSSYDSGFSTLYFSITYPTNGITLWGHRSGYSDWRWNFDKE
jgi:hypothetical protein